MRITSILAAISIFCLVGCTTVGPTPNEIPPNIANASTPADHEKIAAFFSQKAVSYDAEAAWHEKMARTYTSRPKGDMGAMSAHCHTLRDQFVAAAKAARALAQEHRLVASKGG
jgi:hypothetical protein